MLARRRYALAPEDRSRQEGAFTWEGGHERASELRSDELMAGDEWGGDDECCAGWEVLEKTLVYKGPIMEWRGE